MRKAKIICTIGPASSSPATVDRLIAGGMNVARLNFSHGTYEWHVAAITTIRQAAARQGTTVAIIQDLQGPRIRVGLVPQAGIHVTAGQSVRLRAVLSEREARSTDHAVPDDIPVSYPSLTRDLYAGSRILINDGLIELVADRIKDLLPQLENALPASVDVQILGDRTQTIRASVNDVQVEMVRD